MNARRGKQDEFEIVWISRCRSIDDFGQYFTHMKWLALPPQEAMVSPIICSWSLVCVVSALTIAFAFAFAGAKRTVSRRKVQSQIHTHPCAAG